MAERGSVQWVEERLGAVPFLEALAPEARQGLAPRLRLRRLRKGQAIFLQGDPGDEMYLLLEGRVRIACESLNGREVTLQILEEGGVFGEMALLDGELRSASALTDVGGQALVLHRSEFQSFLAATPAAALTLLAFLSRRLRAANDRIQDLALLTVRQRLAALLVELAQREGTPDDGAGWVLDSSVTHRSLAGLLGSSRETVSRMCAELREAGLVEQLGRRLAIRSLPGLQAVVQEAGVR